MLDFTFLSLAYTLYSRERTMFPAFILGSFFGTRGIIQNNFLMKFPKGGIWDFPGIPSLTVPYGLTCDFYYSGHCGFLTLSCYTFYKCGKYWLAALVACFIVYVGFVLVLFRIHYSIDIPIGIMAGLYFAYFTNKYKEELNKVVKVVLCG